MEEKVKKEKMKINLSTAISSIVIVLLVICALVLGYKLYQNDIILESLKKDIEELQKTNEELKKNNEELNKKNEDITNQLNSTQEEKSNETNTTDLTQAEINNFNEYLNKTDNNAFVVTGYTDIDKIDLGTVFNCNLSIAETESENINKEYKKTIEDPEAIIEMPVFKFKKSKIDIFLKEKLGKTYSDVIERLTNNGYVYNSQYDAIYTMHGDTANDTIECVSGTKTSDGKYEINGNYKNLKYNNSKEKVKSFTLTLQKQGDNYLFVSNIQNK